MIHQYIHVCTVICSYVLYKVLVLNKRRVMLMTFLILTEELRLPDTFCSLAFLLSLALSAFPF